MIQVISIDEFGLPKSLRMPTGVGIDLRQFGRVSMRRITEVLMDEDSQNFYVKVMPSGRYLTGSRLAIIPRTKDYDLFETYEIAVQAEIEAYNAMVKESKEFC